LAVGIGGDHAGGRWPVGKREVDSCLEGCAFSEVDGVMQQTHIAQLFHSLEKLGEFGPTAVIHHHGPFNWTVGSGHCGHKFALERVGDHERDQLFGKLERAVVVGRPGDRDVHLVGGAVGEGEEVGAGLGGGVGVGGAEGVVFVGFVRFVDGAVDLVGGDMDEAGDFVAPGGFEEVEGPVEVGADDGLGREDGAVDVGFGGEVDAGVGLDFGEDGLDGSGVGDIGFMEGVAGIGGDGGEVFEVAGVGERVDVGDVDVAGPGEREANEGGADEAGATGNGNFHLCCSSQS